MSVSKVVDKIWRVSFIDYDLGYFDEDRAEPAENPFVTKVLPIVFGKKCNPCVEYAPRRKMVGLEDETSNQLFDTLAQWNDYLENHVPYFQGPEL
ncbi:Uncharacterised protein [Halioglobus japonicus]|nr:Uncharacterised protein [Halioglobus japonicus]